MSTDEIMALYDAEIAKGGSANSIIVRTVQTALAAQAPQAAEPVAWYSAGGDDMEWGQRPPVRGGTWKPLYIAPQAPAAQPLQAFAQAIMGDWPDVGGLDGFELQMLGIEHGLLREDIRHEPCGEACRCVEYSTPDEWQAGVTCYRKSELLTGIAPPAQAPAAQPLTDWQVSDLWIRRPSIHDGDLMLQLYDFARAVERHHGIGIAPLAQAPAAQPLTDRHIDAIANSIMTDDPVQWARRLARLIESRHGIAPPAQGEADHG